MKKNKIKKIRHSSALAARMRKAGPMKDRRQSRGGSKNLQKLYIEDSY